MNSTFQKRLNNKSLDKALGINIASTDIKVSHDYAYASVPVEIHEGKNFVRIKPLNDFVTKRRLMVVINPALAAWGPFNHQSIVEAGEEIDVILAPNGEFPGFLEDEWIMRLYVIS